MEKGLSVNDVKQKIRIISDASTPLKTKKSEFELLLCSCMKNGDFAQALKENEGVFILTTLFKSVDDFELRTKASSLLFFLSLVGHDDAATKKLMNDVNVLSLLNLFLEKDFFILKQAFSGLKVLGDDPSKQKSSSSNSSDQKPSISFSLSSATLFLENVSALINPSSKLLSDSQKTELLSSFAQFVLTGVLSQASAEAEKDANSALSKSFSAAYGAFTNALESCRKGDFSVLDLVVMQMIQLVKDGKLIATAPYFPNDYLNIINSWLNGSKRFVLIHKASVDGFAVSTFHGKCDNKGATVVIITSTEGYVFGGYAAVPWNSNSSNYVPDDSNQSFLFSLKNPRNEQPTKFALKSSQYSIYSDPSYGACFGDNDIWIVNNSNSNANSCTNLGAQAYSNTTGLDGRIVFTGKYNFTAKDIEVYQVL